jgi:hypothetical protein
MMRWEPHVGVDDASISSGRSICPSNPKLPSWNPDFDPDPDANAGCIAEISMTIPFEFERTFVVHGDFKDDVRIRRPVREEFHPRRTGIGKCSGANAVRSVGALDGTSI